MSLGKILSSILFKDLTKVVKDEDDMSSDSNQHVPTQQSVKAYVDGIGGGLSDPIAYDASTNTPDLDTSPSGISAGDFYYVTVAGTFFTEAVEVGDQLIANQLNPTTLSHWIRSERNLNLATTSILGSIKLSTTATVDTGTAVDEAITPDTLAGSAPTMSGANLTNLPTATTGEVNTGTETDKRITPDALTGSAPAILGTNISIARIAGSTYSLVQHMQDVFHSTGETSGGNVSDDADGSITVSAGTGLIRATNSDVAELLFCDWASEAGANVTLVDNDLNYIYVEYNAGSPQAIATTTKRTDWHTNIYLATVYRDGTDLHISNENHVKVSDHAGLMTRRLQETMAWAHASGGAVTEPASLKIAITEAVLWQGLTPVTVPAMDTNVASTFTYYYQDGVGGWTAQTAQTDINATQYDDDSGSLATLGNSRYGVHWIFRGEDADTYVVFGRGSYTLVNAEASEIPANLPPHFEEHARVYAKIIIAKSDTSFTVIETAFNGTFTAGLPTNHSDLGGLSADDHTQYVLADGTRNITGDQILTANLEVQGQAYSPMNTLTDATTIATNCDLGNIHEVTLGGNRTLGAPTNLVDGATYRWVITQDGTGSRTLAYNAVFKFPGGTAPVLSTAAASIDVLIGVSDGTNIYCHMPADSSAGGGIQVATGSFTPDNAANRTISTGVPGGSTLVDIVIQHDTFAQNVRWFHQTSSWYAGIPSVGLVATDTDHFIPSGVDFIVGNSTGAPNRTSGYTCWWSVYYV